MNASAELDRRIAELNARDEEIEEEIFELMPARIKTEARIVFEDYTGETGKLKLARWDRLMAERDKLRQELREAEEKLSRLVRQNR